STLLGPPCPAMIRHCPWLSCAPRRDGLGWYWARAGRDNCWASRGILRDGACRWAGAGRPRWPSIAYEWAVDPSAQPKQWWRAVSAEARGSGASGWSGRPRPPARLPRSDWTTWIAGAD